MADWIDSIGSFIDNNKGWLEPAAELGYGAYAQNQADDQRSSYLDYLKAQENQNYQNSINAINAYNAQGAAAAGARNAATASRAAAARATQANQQAAAKKAQKYLQNTYKNVLKMYAPFKDAALAELPMKTDAYKKALGLQSSMLDFVNRPDQQALLTGSVPSWQINVPLPDSVRIK